MRHRLTLSQGPLLRGLPDSFGEALDGVVATSLCGLPMSLLSSFRNWEDSPYDFNHG